MLKTLPNRFSSTGVAALEMASLDPKLSPISNLAAIKVMRYASQPEGNPKC